MTTLLSSSLDQLITDGRIDLRQPNVHLDYRRALGEDKPMPRLHHRDVWTMAGTVPNLRRLATDIAWLSRIWTIARLDEQEALLQGRQRWATAEQTAYVWARDRARCFYCRRAVMPLKGMHCDHFDSFSRGGLTLTRNLVASCPSCNIEKCDMPGNDYVAQWGARRLAAERALAECGLTAVRFN